MRAVVLREPGPPDRLKLEDVADPSPGAGEVIVRLKAAALNHRDIWIRSGTGAYAGGFAKRVILGSDGAGEVMAVGRGLDRGLIGRAVIINPSLDWGEGEEAPGLGFRILGLPDDGTCAEAIRIPAANVFTKPARLSFEEAAATFAVVSAMRPGSRVVIEEQPTCLAYPVSPGRCFAAPHGLPHRLWRHKLTRSGRSASLCRSYRAVPPTSWHERSRRRYTRAGASP